MCETSFKSRASAMSFAILMSSTYVEGGARRVDYDEAQKLFDFILKNVTLPDVETDSYADLLNSITGHAIEQAHAPTETLGRVKY